MPTNDAPAAPADISHAVNELRNRLERFEQRLDRIDVRQEDGKRDAEAASVRMTRLAQLGDAHLDPTEKTRYLGHLITLCGVRPTDAVLDVGCGPGRVARELSRYLAAEGSYYGIEIRAKWVGQLRDEYAARPNFRFFHADIKNTAYNPNGSLSPVDYKFPLPDRSVRLVLVRSVFTHMLPEEVESYAREIARVLRPGGRSLITYYLLNEQSRPFVESRQRPIYAAYPFDGRGSFPHDYGTHRVRYTEVPERAVAYDEQFIRSLYANCQMKVMEPIQYGSWSGRMHYLSGQDIVVAEKIEGPEP